MVSTVNERNQILFMNKAIVICGPTGIGKTSFAIQICKRFNGEVVSADSMQIYKHMDIGTAKPDKNELSQARHHLVDFVNPGNDFDAGLFVKTADKAILDIVSRNKIPIIAGGTGLYIRALVHGLFRSHPVCRETMERLTEQLKNDGPDALHEKLQQCDPVSAEKIHPNDSFRVLRALEIFETSGVRMSEYQKKHHFGQNRYNTLKIGLRMDRDTLYSRINRRVDIMLEQDLLGEVQALVDNGYDLNLKSMQSIGYKHMGLYINGEVSWEEAVRLLKRDTRRYAKRQFTWFNKDKEIHWFSPDQFNEAKPLIKEFLT